MNNFNWNRFEKSLPTELHNHLQTMKMIKEQNSPLPNAYMHVRIMTERLSQMNGSSMLLAAFFCHLGKAVMLNQGKKAPFHGYELESLRLVYNHRDLILRYRGNAYLIQEMVKNHFKMEQMKQSEKNEKMNKQNLTLMQQYPNYYFPRRPVMTKEKVKEIQSLSIYPMLRFIQSASDMDRDFVHKITISQSH